MSMFNWFKRQSKEEFSEMMNRIIYAVYDMGKFDKHSLRIELKKRGFKYSMKQVQTGIEEMKRLNMLDSNFTIPYYSLRAADIFFDELNK